jgi:tetratricopeptide (TPR) repeat protein
VDLIRQAIAIGDGASAPAYLNLAGGLNRLRRFEEGLASADKALALDPNLADAHNNRGNALYGLRRLREALDAYNQAVDLKADHAEAWNNRGNVLLRLTRNDEALASHDKAITLRPNHAIAHCDRGKVLRSMHRSAEALESCDRAIALDPNQAAAHINRAAVLKDLGRPDEALASSRKALELEPLDVETISTLGNMLKDLRQLPEALACQEKAIALDPNVAEVWSNHGAVLSDIGRVDEAIASFDRAIALNPDHAQAHCNLGATLLELGRLDEALACNARALQIEPHYARAQFHTGLCRLAVGRLEEGWRLYEQRKKVDGLLAPRSHVRPEWLGEEDLAGKTILVHAEQGLGDTLQFCRYLKLLERRGAKVSFAVQDMLRRLVGMISQTIEIVGFDEVPAQFDFHCYLMSLPLAFGTTLETIPADVPYLRAEPELIARWKQRIGANGFKIGVNWRGNEAAGDQGRSFQLREMAGLSRVPGVRLISLQKGPGTEQLADLPEGMKVETLGDDFDAGSDAFVDTAAVMETLDLVITSDTSVAHLAGAMARPAWVALKHAAEWRWLQNRRESPWYPTSRLFRQPARGNWTAVFEAMVKELPLRSSLGATPT